MPAQRKQQSATQSAIPVVSLFSGCGGLDLGFEQAGFEALLAYDADKAACNTYSANRPKRAPAQVADLSHLSPDEIVRSLPDGQFPRGVIGGPPCQAFSVSNVYKHPEDPRSRLPINYARILERLNRDGGLDFFLFENVFGLRSTRHAEQFRLFKELFGAAGFRLFEEELDAADFGVPQHRRRVFIVGFNAERFGDRDFVFPQGGAPHRTLRDAIGDLPAPVIFERGLTREVIRERAGHPNHWTMRPRSSKFVNANGELRPRDRRGRAFRVLDWDEPSMTVAYGHREVHVHPNMSRRLSIHEAMRLQGFPDSYELVGTLSDQIRMVSDAVPPPLANALAEAIRSHIDPGKPREPAKPAGTKRVVGVASR